LSSHAPSRGAALLAWGLTLLGLVLLGALFLIAVADHTSMSQFVSDNSFVLVFAVVFPITGALVASRHPRNAVGWLMLGGPSSRPSSRPRTPTHSTPW
jgi:ABC-type Na+ efflux pump permease subunit